MYTKGEWKVTKRIDTYNIDKGTLAVANIPDKYANSEANAHLIAAAPGMYEALKAALYFIETCGNESHLSGDSDNCSHCLIKKNATLALAKARGE